ncbi:unnamed protein product [Prorocentrum cordatum]|uniref:Zinc-ribbon domain-containing protein n=1 Tax=Prorocentrum cordatum TaxID=2364126 RepID=A0ABN9S3R6_9DINO|nr:unnamed protein product [Polarella glacialis]
MRTTHIIFGRLRLGLRVARTVAQERGGHCLAEEYTNNAALLQWRCAKKHEWMASLNSVKDRQTWCPECFHNKRRLDIGVAHQVASSLSGQCLSTEYSSSARKLHWVCASGHEWFATLNSVKDNSTWCPHCAQTYRLSLSEAQSWAMARGGRCLSKNYTNASTKLQWQCAEGHQWHAGFGGMRWSGSWCPQCAKDRIRLGIRVAQAFARARGGLCLSERYYNNQTALRWQCKLGHQWEDSLKRLKQSGAWCPTCHPRHKRLGIATARTVARKHGGWCLSDQYESLRTPMRWRCANGHEWSASLEGIRNRGTWCHICAGTRLDITVAQNEARMRAGFCLSVSYKNSLSPLEWECSLGHRWHAPLRNIRHTGTWCPQCAAGKSEREVRAIFETIFSGRTFAKCRPEFLVGAQGRRLELDGYCRYLNLAFEYNGEQHFEANNFFNLKEKGNYEAQLARDCLKRNRCEGLGLRLVIVPYWVKDRWTFIRCSLLRWFALSDIFPAGLAA